MPLDEYRRKRDFTKSPEPAGKNARRTAKSRALFFCVQKHLASHLHYDLRLEWNGVLLSWAVPKGPSIDSSDKRLAMHVEDHPIEYGTFEGVIPEGYGAGIVMLWDCGTWTPEVPDVDAALQKGDLKFTLDGYKLKGSWVLVRTRGYGGYGGSRTSGTTEGKSSWLLIKHKDEWSGPLDITEFAPLSVKTPDADFADILGAKTPALWSSNPPAKTGDTGKLFARIIEQAFASSNTRDTKNRKRTSNAKGATNTKGAKVLKGAKARAR
jgi:bifunctional non-homologous end joining protein LigD